MEKLLHAETKRRQQFRCPCSIKPYKEKMGKNVVQFFHSPAVSDEKPENIFRGILPSVEGILQ